MKIRLGGVPEHFNLPIQLAIEQGVFAKNGFEIDWQYFPGGTGAMTKALDEESLDMAILLTEGFVAARNKGLKAKIVKSYIDSPLVWGIFTGSHSPIQSIYDGGEKKYAISRFGSGSHLMAMIHAQQRGEEIKPENWLVINDMKTAAEKLKTNEADIFYWEKYTAKPYVVDGSMLQIGEFAAPWSGFLMVANEIFLAKNETAVQSFLVLINEITQHYKNDSFFQQTVCTRFDLTENEMKHWIKSTIWNNNFSIKAQGIHNAIHSLQAVSDAALTTDLSFYCTPLVELK
jgi:ABC-type nitrate/sulfonate/bicarbonate transport system substrate-binding protein